MFLETLIGAADLMTHSYHKFTIWETKQQNIWVPTIKEKTKGKPNLHAVFYI